ncbi:hypothetical protein V6N11_079894 [Hibiscus sabdariffa]|uniref:RNase H type-1 domain-containing protein n=1 Tax=Hibiscus sabdariffa TaxID=183260 RepID=A0ABR2RWQ5_9ROSI
MFYSRGRTLGVFMRLYSTWEYGLRKVVVGVDSLDVLRCIRNFDSSSGTSSLILHVQNLISCDWEVTTQNLFKEGNKVADRFARAVRLKDLGVMVHYRPRLDVVAMFQQDR